MSHGRVAILIPTLNRPEFVARACRYYENAHVGLLFGDSSPEEATRKRNLDAIGDCAANAQVYWMPELYDAQEGKTRFGEVLEQLGKNAKEEGFVYCLHAGDDDFIIPDAVNAMAAWLDDHPEYVAAYGIRLRFGLDRKGPYGNIVHLSKCDYPDYDQDDPIARMRAYFSAPFTMQFAVTRVDAWNEIHKDMAKKPVWYFGNEVLPNVLLALKGKSHFIPALSVVFQVNSERPFGWDTHTMYDLITHPKFSETFQEMRAMIPAEAGEAFEVEMKNHISDMMGMQRAGWRVSRGEPTETVPFQVPTDYPFYKDLFPIVNLIQQGGPDENRCGSPVIPGGVTEDVA